MTPDQYEQEFECSWVANVPGAIFGKELQDIQEKGRISSVPYDPTVRVDTWWDLGVGDSTAIWFTQSLWAGRCMSSIFTRTGRRLAALREGACRDKDYFYGTHNAPHDIEVASWALAKAGERLPGI